MSARQPILGLLRQYSDRSVDQALSAAMSSADEKDLPGIVRTLLERDRPESLSSVILQFHRLPGSVQKQVTSHTSQLEKCLKRASVYRNGQVAVNIIHLIRESKDLRLSQLAAEQLGAGEREVREEAARCLWELAEGVARAGVGGAGGDARIFDPPLNQDEQGVRRLISALELGLRRYREHRCEEVLLAALVLMPVRPSAVRVAVDQPGQDFYGYAVGAMGKVLEMGLIGSLISGLACPHFGRAAAAGLHRAAREGRWEELLGGAHLASDPSVGRAMAKVPQAHRLTPSPHLWGKLSEGACGGLVRWAVALGLPVKERAKLLGSMVKLPYVSARLAAVDALAALGRVQRVDAVWEALGEFAIKDEDGRVSRVAMRALEGSRWIGVVRMLPRLANSPHGPVGEMAQRRLAGVGFGRLWASWGRLNQRQRVLAGRAMMRLVPDFADQLGRKLTEGSVRERLRAMSMIQALELGGLFERGLLEMARGEDVVLASAAMRTLGKVASIEVMATLELGLSHRDARVRANAIETLGPSAVHRQRANLERLATEASARPRAMAIGQLLREHPQRGLEHLKRMLHDTRAEHRRSAVWVARQVLRRGSRAGREEGEAA